MKQKNDPKLIAAARELRDRWLEHVNANEIAPTLAKYDVVRRIETASPTKAIALLPAA